MYGYIDYNLQPQKRQQNDTTKSSNTPKREKTSRPISRHHQPQTLFPPHWRYLHPLGKGIHPLPRQTPSQRNGRARDAVLSLSKGQPIPHPLCIRQKNFRLHPESGVKRHPLPLPPRSSHRFG